MSARRVYVGGPDAEAALPEFAAAGLDARPAGGAAGLREADARGERYLLVHVGADDGEPAGSFERAHHRIGLEEVPGLALRLRPRAKPLVTCLAFGYKNGLPPDATWLVDVRFLDNPYWVPDLRPLSGRDRPVVEYVLGQPAAQQLLDRLESALRWAIPLYQRDELTVAFGCTGGRHRSVALAEEMARRLSRMAGIEVRFEARDL